ncbi:DUF4139 domain-containing protein [Dysgonomonas sp. Marseille-P4361]|uniref:DUF4139 domain-containing protein n=1 Tax=Dysgonomonas sp. Marseille-P4361 TaxID=2161820 RepID=UPI000D552974|nr:DUF4139 domain-containing protein [Dysgonomonas sp. Marseille-P4361]
MRTKLFIITVLLFAICSSGAYSQDKKTTKAVLNEATVFFQGAELIHSATYTLAKGENELFIEGLSPSIDKNSLKIKTTNNVIVSAYEFSVDFLSGSKGKSSVVKKLQDSIDFYQKRLNEIETEITINEDMIEFLEKGTDKNVSGSEKGLGIDELVKTMEYYKTKAFELQSTLTASNKKKDETEETISRLRKQLSTESLKNDKSSGVLKLKLTAPASGSCNFTISYYTTAAGWMPYYDINITSTDQPIKIAAKSRVKQTTGMDWEKVKLTLSSATPSKGKTAPLFSAWFVDYVQPNLSALHGVTTSVPSQNSYSYNEKSAAKKTPKEGEFWIRGISSLNSNTQPLYVVDGQIVEDLNSIDIAMVKDFQVLKDASATGIYGARASNGVVVISLKESMDDFVTQAETDLNIAYNIDLPYTIPGNGKEQIIDLQTKETTAEYKYYCAPKLDTETYLLAEISDWQKLNLLSGKANITYEGTYVGESQIEASSTQQKLTLTLGSDKRVTVKREKMQDFSSGAKFLGNDIKQAFTYKLTVRNNQNKAIKMVLKDQYPISMQKEIEVELLTKETTPWTANKEDLGVITWEEELKAGETKTYKMSYTVKYPKGRKLNL